MLVITFAYFGFGKYKKKQSLIIEEKNSLLDSTSKFKAQYEIDNFGVLVELAKAKDPAFFLKFNEFNPGFKDKLLKKYECSRS